MRLEITRTTEGPLPLVTSIPNFGVAQLEGYNGVGKTLTVRLLELCSGTRPRLPREVWRSFCAGLGELSVTATELVGANELAWEIDGEVLLEASEAAGHDAPPNDAWFVSITHDGRKTSVEEIRTLFAVERIAGDRGLIEMLADEADSAAGELTLLSETISDSATLAGLESAFAELKTLLPGFSSAAIREHRDEAERARQERDVAKKVLADAVRKYEALLEIAEIRARVSAISEEAEVLSSKVAAIDQEINQIREARDVAARGLADAEAEAGQSNEVRDAVAKADRQYRRATKDRERLTSELAQLEGMVGLPSGSDAAALDRRVGEIQERLVLLERRRNEIDAAPGVVKLVDGVRPALTGAITAGLGDVELLRRPDDPLNIWTVSDVSDALARRRDEVDAVPSPREAVAIDEEIRRLRSAVEAVGTIRDKRRLLERAVERQDAAQTLATELSARLDSAIAENLDHLRTSRRHLDDRLYELTASRTILEYRRDTIGSPEERDALRVRLARQLEAAGLVADDLDAALTESTRQADIERQAFAQVQERDRAASAQFDRDMANVRALVVRLRESDPFGWLRQGPTETMIPSLESSLDQQLDRLDSLAAAVATADRRLDTFRGLFLGLQQNLRELAQELRTAQGLAIRREAHWAALHDALEAVAEEWFANYEVRSALLDTEATEVEVDLTTRQVSWQDTSGRSHAKPLEALSSGEQAFAFTQAQLALLQHTQRPATNRLIVLDEFGAFVSADRLTPLRRYLHDWHAKHDQDQILVILPASRDYKSLAATAATSVQRERFERMATALADRHWFVEEFES